MGEQLRMLTEKMDQLLGREVETPKASSTTTDFIRRASSTADAQESLEVNVDKSNEGDSITVALTEVEARETGIDNLPELELGEFQTESSDGVSKPVFSGNDPQWWSSSIETGVIAEVSVPEVNSSIRIHDRGMFVNEIVVPFVNYKSMDVSIESQSESMHISLGRPILGKEFLDDPGGILILRNETTNEDNLVQARKVFGEMCRRDGRDLCPTPNVLAFSLITAMLTVVAGSTVAIIGLGHVGLPDSRSIGTALDNIKYDMAKDFRVEGAGRGLIVQEDLDVGDTTLEILEPLIISEELVYESDMFLILKDLTDTSYETIVYFGKSQGMSERKSIVRLGMPIRIEIPMEELPRLPLDKSKSEDKSASVHWEEKFDHHVSGTKLSSRDNSFLIGSGIDVHVGQEMDASGGKRTGFSTDVREQIYKVAPDNCVTMGLVKWVCNVMTNVIVWMEASTTSICRRLENELARGCCTDSLARKVSTLGLLSTQIEEGYSRGEHEFILVGIPWKRMQADIPTQLADMELHVDRFVLDMNVVAPGFIVATYDATLLEGTIIRVVVLASTSIEAADLRSWGKRHRGVDAVRTRFELYLKMAVAEYFVVKDGVRDIEKATKAFSDNPSLEFVKADVTEGAWKLAEAIGDDSEDVVSATGFSISWDLTLPWKVDNFGAVNLVDACQKIGVNRFILISSILVNGAAMGQLLKTPKHWMLAKLGGAFSPTPSYEPHKPRECLPVILILRNKLQYALTNSEVVARRMQRYTSIDEKVSTDKTYPAGFMDVKLLTDPAATMGTDTASKTGQYASEKGGQTSDMASEKASDMKLMGKDTASKARNYASKTAQVAKEWVQIGWHSGKDKATGATQTAEEANEYAKQTRTDKVKDAQATKDNAKTKLNEVKYITEGTASDKTQRATSVGVNIVLCCSLGGGTIDVSLVISAEVIIEVTATAGATQLEMQNGPGSQSIMLGLDHGKNDAVLLVEASKLELGKAANDDCTVGGSPHATVVGAKAGDGTKQYTATTLIFVSNTGDFEAGTNGQTREHGDFEAVGMLTVTLPHIPRPKMKVCMLGDAQHVEEAEKMGLEEAGITLGAIPVYPIAILAKRSIPIGSNNVPQLLVQWSGSSTTDATWEAHDYIASHFPGFLNLRTILLSGEGNVMSLAET